MVARQSGFCGVGSISDVAVQVFTSVVPAAAVTVPLIVIAGSGPIGASYPAARVQRTPRGGMYRPHDQPEPDAETYSVPTGRVSFTTTSRARSGPALVPWIVQEIVSPEKIVAGPVFTNVRSAGARTVVLADELIGGKPVADTDAVLVTNAGNVAPGISNRTLTLMESDRVGSKFGRVQFT